MVGSNDPEEGTTQLSPELWIDLGITTFLSPSLNDSDLKKTLVDPRTGGRKPWG
jgi:hypothetical protein